MRVNRQGETRVPLKQTVWEGTPRPKNQTAGDGTQAPRRRNHFEEEYQEEEEDLFSILDEEWQHWAEVETLQGPTRKIEKLGDVIKDRKRC